jgi:hypothetical protein
VQHEQFPNIVPELNDPESTFSVAHFDSTFTHFDNNVCAAASIIYLCCIFNDLQRNGVH